MAEPNTYRKSSVNMIGWMRHVGEPLGHAGDHAQAPADEQRRLAAVAA